MPVESTPRVPSPAKAMNRYEVKYLVASKSVPSLIAEFGPYLIRDAHWTDEFGYRVFSQYWDTPDLLFFWEKVEGLKYRRKLRFRRYAEDPDVHIEIKQREDRTLQKRRLQWPTARALEVFGDGRSPPRWDDIRDDPVATEVGLMIERLRLRPRVGVLYRRRAFFGRFDPELRITFDGRIQFRPAPVDLIGMFDTGRYVLDPRVTVMEAKFDHRAPRWLTKAVGRHGLKMVRMSKYCSAVDRHWFGGQNT